MVHLRRRRRAKDENGRLRKLMDYEGIATALSDDNLSSIKGLEFFDLSRLPEGFAALRSE